MKAIVGHLNEDDMVAIAAYLASRNSIVSSIQATMTGWSRQRVDP